MIRNIVSLAFSLLFAAVAAGGYAFLLQQINASIIVVEQIQGDIASAGKRSATADSMDTFLESIGDQRRELEAMTVEDDAVASVIEAIEAEARRDKVAVTVSSVTKGTEQGWKKHGTVRMNLTGEGSYQALATFATALEALPLGSHLTSLAIQATAASSDAKKGTPPPGWFGEFTVVFVARLPQQP